MRLWLVCVDESVCVGHTSFQECSVEKGSGAAAPRCTPADNVVGVRDWGFEKESLCVV